MRRSRGFKLIMSYLAIVLIGMDATESHAANEAAKAEQVRAILQGRGFQLSDANPKAFCEPFLEDFRTMKGIVFVEPVVRAERFDDPRLQAHQARCPHWPMNQLEVLTRPQDEVGWKFYGTRDFKLFQAEMNDNPDDGAELIFYAERFEREDFHEGRAQRRSERERKISEQARYINGAYSVINPKTCTAVGLMSIKDPYDYRKQEKINNVNGVIFYHGKHYLFDLFVLVPGTAIYSMEVKGYSAEQNGLRTVCLFHPQLSEEEKK